ncbi:2815_t:CDS:2, partial [Acaulospora colombiana]
MIDKDNDKTTLVEDEPPPYSRRQPSTSSNHPGGRNRLQSAHNTSPTTAAGPGSRFIAPVPAPQSGSQALPPLPSPRLIISPAETQGYPSTSDGRNPSFVDLAYEKPDSPNGFESDCLTLRAALMQGGYTMPHGDQQQLMGFANDSQSVVYPQQSAVGDGDTYLDGDGYEWDVDEPYRRRNQDGTYTGCAFSFLSSLAVLMVKVVGVYNVDPNLEVTDYATARRSATLGNGKSHSRNSSAASINDKKKNKGKQDLSWRPSAAPSACHGFFETKSGIMEILLSIGGSGSNIASRANIDVRNKHGKTNLKLMDIAPGRKINLEIFSVEGLLHVHTDGEIMLLPSVAGAMEVVSARDDDALVMIAPSIKVTSPSPTASSASSPRLRTSDPVSSYGRASPSFIPGGFSDFLHPHTSGRTSSYEGDYANITSTSGNIIVGFVGEDQIKEPSGGMWKKIVSLFTGGRPWAAAVSQSVIYIGAYEAGLRRVALSRDRRAEHHELIYDDDAALHA